VTKQKVKKQLVIDTKNNKIKIEKWVLGVGGRDWDWKKT
jgi:hypothetical protein